MGMPLEFGHLPPRPLREDPLGPKGAGGWGKPLQALLPDILDGLRQHFQLHRCSKTFISQFYRIFLKTMTWFHDVFPHPLTPSRKTLCLKRGGGM